MSYAIYKQTMKKYLRAKSTWIILICSMLMSGVLGGWLPFSILTTDKPDSMQKYAMTVVAIVGVITAFLSLFVSVFAGFKTATMYKDEVENGTFLMMLSKPQSRKRIIFQKWLALQTIMVIYSFLTILMFVIFVAIFDKGPDIQGLASAGLYSLSSRIISVGSIMFAILFVIGLIFTSIALLLSTKLSVGSTIGISIAIGVVIPISGMISTFTATPAYQALGSRFRQTSSVMFDKLRDTADLFKKNLLEQKDLDKIPTSIKDVLDTDFDPLTENVNRLYESALKVVGNSKTGLANLGMATGQTDSFDYLKFIDLNYQVHSIGSMASNRVVPDSYSSLTHNSKWSLATGVPFSTEATTHGLLENSHVDRVFNLIRTNIDPVMRTGYAIRNFLLSKHIMNTGYTLEPKYALLAKNMANLDEVNQFLTFDKYMCTSPITLILDGEQLKSSFESLGTKLIQYDPVLSEFQRQFDDEMADVTVWDDDPTLMLQQQTPQTNPLGGVITSVVTSMHHSTFYVPFTASDYTAMRELFTIARYDDVHHTDHLEMVKTVPYANKYTILFIYLAIAIILVPISFLVVKKQDFK